MNKDQFRNNTISGFSVGMPPTGGLYGLPLALRAGGQLRPDGINTYSLILPSNSGTGGVPTIPSTAGSETGIPRL